MICQQNANQITDNIGIADYNILENIITTSPIPYGMRLAFANGEQCGAVPRTVNVDFLCDNTISQDQSYLTQFTEPSVCQYDLQVRTSLVCNGNNPAPAYSSTGSSGGGSTDSDSSTGMSSGAITGIVLVILIAAIVGIFLAFKGYQKYGPGATGGGSARFDSRGGRLLGDDYKSSTELNML